MSSLPTSSACPPIIEPMSAPQVELDELYRMSTEEYHRLIEAGAFEDFPNCELIDGVLVRKDIKSPEHENAIAWLNEWLMFAIDRARFQVRVGARSPWRIRARARSRGDLARRAAAVSPRDRGACDRGVVVVAAARPATAKPRSMRRPGSTSTGSSTSTRGASSCIARRAQRRLRRGREVRARRARRRRRPAGPARRVVRARRSLLCRDLGPARQPGRTQRGPDGCRPLPCCVG